MLTEVLAQQGDDNENTIIDTERLRGSSLSNSWLAGTSRLEPEVIPVLTDLAYAV